MRSVVLSIVALLLASSLSATAGLPRVYSKVVDGIRKVYGNDGFSGEVLLGEVKTIPAGTPLYVWTNRAPAEDGTFGLSAEEFSARRADYDPRSNWAGGGFYVSRDPLNSSDYGTRLLVVENPRPITYLDVDPLQATLIVGNPEAEKLFPGLPEVTGEHAFSLLLEREGVDAWEYRYRGTSEAWLNILRAEGIGAFRMPTDAEVFAKFLGANPRASPERLAKLKRLFPKGCASLLAP